MVALLPLKAFSQSQNMNVLDGWYKYNDVKHALYNHYLSEAEKMVSKREKQIDKLATKADWQTRQRQVKKILQNIAGRLPEKTPLQPQVLGISDMGDYRIEKVVFQSRPHFFVTAALFVPKRLTSKAPAVIFASGHIDNAFRDPNKQMTCINLVKKGFIVLAFDPIGQGERLQYYSPDSGKSLIGGSVAEHMYAGLQTLLAGKGLANYFIWDGIRAVDYLLTRKEVDASRIGITGISGGGTQTTFIAAYDDRIAAAAPTCFITSMRRLFESAGPQDAEQNLYHGLAFGLDFADLLEVRIPKPALMITTTRDFFSIQGAKETQTEVQKVYDVFDAAENFGRAEDDTVHAITLKNREARYAFFQREFDVRGTAEELEVKPLAQELQITETGQISTQFNSETVFSLNKKEAEKLLKKIEKARKNPQKHLKDVISAAKKLTGYKAPEKVENSVFCGRYQYPAYSVEKYFINGENGDYPIPFLLFLPGNISAPPILYLNKNGKQAGFNENGEIAAFINKGHPVLAADLITIGEMKQQSYEYSFGQYGKLAYSNYFAAILQNKSLVGIQAADIKRLTLFIKQSPWFKGKDIYAIADGQLLSASLLHVQAFEKDFSKVVLINPLISYKSIVTHQYYCVESYPPFVEGVLTAYDLPDLCAAVTPNKLFLINIRDHLGRLANRDVLENELKFTKEVFKSIGMEKYPQVKQIENTANMEKIVGLWLNN